MKSQFCDRFFVCVSSQTGCVNALLTTPLWVTNTRLKLQGSALNKNKSDYDSGVRGEAEFKGLIGLDIRKKR